MDHKTIVEIVDAPRDQRINPTFYPTPQRYNWELFEVKRNTNPNILNLPRLPSQDLGKTHTEKDFLVTLEVILEK